MYKFSAVCWTYLYVVRMLIHAETSINFELSTVETIKRYGYPVEIYSDTVTEDGYLLDIYRIPHGRYGKKEEKRIPVIVMHALWRTSEDYVNPGPEKGLAFLLVDRGYDVWLPNARGSPHSRKHLTLNPDVDAKFWKFSWHEIGLYDLPATLNLIRDVTKVERFSYIGLSEGTTYFYVLASMRPEYNRNFTIMISFGPTAYMPNTNPLIKMGSAFEPILTSMAKRLHIYEGKQLTELIPIASRIFCTREGFFQNTCRELLFITGGNDPEQTDASLMPAVFQVGLTGGVRQYLHHMQNINSGEFRQFDFGRKMNLKKYGTLKPPSYNLSQISAPVAIFYSDGDWIISPVDAERVCTELGNCAYKYKIPWKEFNHFDYVLAKGVVDLVFQQVFYVLDKYNNK